MGIIILKVVVTWFVAMYALLSAIWPINDKDTSTQWKITHAVLFILFELWLWNIV